jgi:L-alanine-DL-glutamate epimerase-like enolase superfamily enzyme
MTEHRTVSITADAWPLRQQFSISRGSKQMAETICVEIRENGHVGRGEAVPYGRYGETVESVTASIESLIPMLEKGMTQTQLSEALLPGAARCAVDCALWDLQAKQQGRAIWQLLDMAPPRVLQTAFTITLDSADKMAAQAAQGRAFPLLKIKLGGADGMLADIARLSEICNARPDAHLIVDANEGWSVDDIARYEQQLGRYGVQFFEQPVPAAHDAALEGCQLPLCADESVHDTDSLDALSPAYQWINIKLDKTGGLSEALNMVARARQMDLKIMVGCMVATSLSMAPAFHIGQNAEMIDLDGPLWLAKDRTDGHVYSGSSMHPPSAALWG